jgi:hypothetical protein
LEVCRFEGRSELSGKRKDVKGALPSGKMVGCFGFVFVIMVLGVGAVLADTHPKGSRVTMNIGGFTIKKAESKLAFGTRWVIMYV